MTAFAPSLSIGRTRTPSMMRIDDAALGQQIGWALLGGDEGEQTPLIDGYRLEGAPDIVDGIARYDATRDEDGRWLLVELPTRETAANPERRDEFARVAFAELALRHKNVHAVLEVGTASDGRPFRVREAADTEPLATVLGRERALSWRRVRSIALQLCSGLSAARAHGLRPKELSLVACRRSRHSIATDEVKLGELEPIADNDRGDVPALATIIEQLSGFKPGGDPSQVARLGVPTAELAELLARARSSDPKLRYADAGQLGRAIALIGKGVTPWSRARSNATSGTIMARGPFAPAMPGTMVVACSRADALVVPADRSVAPLPTVIVAGAVASPRTRRRRFGALGASLALVMMLGASSLVSPQVRANAVAVARAAVHVIDRGMHELEPEAISPERTPVAMASIAPPRGFVAADEPAPSEPIAVAPAPVIATAPAIVVTPPIPTPPPTQTTIVRDAAPAPATTTPAKKKARRIAKPRVAAAAVVAPASADAEAPAPSEPTEAPAPSEPAVASEPTSEPTPPGDDAIPIPEP